MKKKICHRLYAMLMKMQEKRLSYVLYYVNGGNVREFLSFFRTPKDMSQVTVTVWAILADLHLQYRGCAFVFWFALILPTFCLPIIWLSRTTGCLGRNNVFESITDILEPFSLQRRNFAQLERPVKLHHSQRTLSEHEI